ncbi:MAG: AAA family ATPase [Pseudomonadota bacterium]
MPRPRDYRTLYSETDPFELGVLLTYVDNLRRRAPTLGIPESRLKAALGSALDLNASGVRDDWQDGQPEAEADAPSLAELVSLLKKMRAELRSLALPVCSSMQAHVNALAQFFSLDAHTAALYGLILRLTMCDKVSALWKACYLYDDPDLKPRSLAWLLAVAGVPRSCAEALSPNGVLVSAGLCSVDCTGDIAVPEAVKRLVHAYPTPPADLTEHLIGRTQRAELDWDSFSHLGDARELLARLMGRSNGACGDGLHVLLYGPPGTGKTEFAKTLAGQIGLPLVALGETDEEGDEPDRSERLATLRRASYMLRRRKRKIVLMVDEAEDLVCGEESFDFAGRRLSRPPGSKVYLHRLMESLPVPVIWIVNDPWRVPSTVIRRMTYAMELRCPGAAVRRRIWDKALATSGVTASDAELDALARDLVTVPAIASAAARAATLAGGGVAEAREVAESLLKAMNGGKATPPRPRMTDDYLPSLLNADRRSLHVLEQVARPSSSRTPFSLCLYGPPGTGKSAYARHLARSMGIEVIQKRTSDLLGMWVGETEKNIADAFREARSEGAMLIFDEADSLLRSREHARAHWEISQVNEMLTWMESHPLPFVCTTNFMDALDGASLRRFMFKLRVEYLDRERARLAFVHFFGRPAPHELDELDLLTPADFALVRKRAELGGFLGDDAVLIGLLRDEMRVKPDCRRGIGFQAV